MTIQQLIIYYENKIADLKLELIDKTILGQIPLLAEINTMYKFINHLHEITN